MPQPDSDSTDCIFSQDGALPHWGTKVHTFFNQHLPNRWIGRNGHAEDVFCPRSPRPPDHEIFMGLCDIRAHTYTHKTIEKLLVCICIALATTQMLQNVCCEMEYPLDVVRVTKGSHIEHI
ncbi:uncharacterized protein TNCV_1692631 [Trichonephila clavipes]|nr:uncharacterized protein TNCV_1692631 [Trichonephila clavipes]